MYQSCRLPKEDKSGKMLVKMLQDNEIVNALPHLNATNACRHFFAFGKGHYNAFFCPEWFYKPIDKLIPFQRLAYSHFSFDKHLNGTHTYTANDTIQTDYPNLHSVPYPSTLHFNRFKHLMPQFAYVQERKSLMFFIGKDDHGDTLVRKQIAKLCKQYDRQETVLVCQEMDDQIRHIQVKSRLLLGASWRFAVAKVIIGFHYVWLHSSPLFRTNGRCGSLVLARLEGSRTSAGPTR